jgi:hypothetical protein
VKKDPKAPVIMGRGMIACNTPLLQQYWDGKRHHKYRQRYFFFCFCRFTPTAPCTPSARRWSVAAKPFLKAFWLPGGPDLPRYACHRTKA